MRRAAMAALVLATLGAAAPRAEEPGASLEIVFTDLRSDRGLIRLCLTAVSGNFPKCEDDAHAVTRTIPAGAGSVRIDGLPPGDYAFAVIHDENANARLDTFAGIPREGFGFSRNPRIGFGPPPFGAAQFALAADGAVQRVRLRYLL